MGRRASAEKIGAVSPYLVLGLDAVTAIVTDAQDTPALRALQNAAPIIKATR